MARKKAAQKKPRGIRARTLDDGTTKYDALVTIARGKQKSLGAYDTFDDAVAARHAYFKAQAAKGEHVSVDPGLLTVRQLGALCLKARSEEWDEDRWRARVAGTAHFIDWPAAQVRDEHVQVWIDQMANTPIATGRSAGQLPAQATVYAALALLRRVYRWGKMPARKLVTHNPCEHVTIGNSTETVLQTQRHVLDYLREDEVKAILDAPPEVLPLEPRTKFLVLAFAGCRPADLWRLSWDKIDWAAEIVRFSSSKTSKREAHDYTVHCLPRLMTALREWHLQCGRRETGLVFPNHDGERFARGYDGGWADKKYRLRRRTQVDGVVVDVRKDERVTVQKGYRSLLGIRRDVPLYALRHTCACHLLLGTELFTGGRSWSREEVQSQLGHRDSAATEHYMLALGILGKKAADESREAMKKGEARAARKLRRV